MIGKVLLSFQRKIITYNKSLTNKKYKVKYSAIRTADKRKWYYANDRNFDCFAFLPGAYPAEYALQIDYDKQFEKTILEPCNRIISILNYKTLTSNLCYTAALW